MQTEPLPDSTVSAHPAPAAYSATASGGRGRRRRKDRGLPAEDALRDLARTYLETQRRLWPELAAAGRIPEPTEEILTAYAEAFRQAFLGEAVPAGSWDEVPTGPVTAAVYLRFSSENSNPRSLDQQLRLTLERARRENHFVRWQHVYADSGVTGTTAARAGYHLTKAAMNGRSGPKALHVDDLSRLSRDMVESIRFCRDLCDKGRRVIGASDGFDTELEQYKAILAVSGVVHEFYVDGLKKKVLRGQDDGFRQGKNLQPPAFGYHLVPVVGPDGQPLLGRKRRQLLRVEVCEAQAAVVREVFRRYAELGQSLLAIARWLNEIAEGGRRSWGPSQVGDMLDRPVYVGIEIRGMTRQRKDRETGKITEEKRPPSEWLKRRAPQLAIVDRRTWRAVRQRRKERAGLFPEGSRGRVETYPARLLTLVCGGCGATLTLGKSGEYAQVRCPNAAEGKHGCTFGGYKSLARIEGAVLAIVSERLSDPAVVERLVAAANAAVEAMARAPRLDLAPLEERVRELREAERRLVEAIATSDAAVGALTSRLEENQRQLAQARARLAEARAASADPPEPLTAEEVRSMLADLRGLLAEEAPVAAPVLRELLGEVVVTQQAELGRDKPVWYATFRVDVLRAATRNGADSARRLPRLLGGADEPRRERLRLDPLPKPPKAKKVPPYQRLAVEAVRLRDEGLSFKMIGERLGVHEVTAMRAVDYARPEERPEKGRKRPQRGKAAQVRCRVAELLADGMSPAEAAREAGCSAMTAYRVQRELRDQGPGSEAA